MLSAMVLPAVIGLAGPINLYRGAPLVSPRYWDVEDTYLDVVEPEKGEGGSYTLLGGKGRTILIRFGDLNRVIGPHKHVTKATLFLTPSGSAPPVLHSAGRILQSWGEGPRTVLTSLFVAPPKPGVKAPPTHWQADYRQRKAGIANWKSPGAMSDEDQAPIKAAHLDPGDREVSIGGLEESVQTMVDHPAENNGFALVFESACEFSSSKANTGRPRLELEVEDVAETKGPDLSVISVTSDPVDPKAGQEVSYIATIKNVGDAESQGFLGFWSTNEKQSSTFERKEALAVGATATFSLQKRFEPSPNDHRVNPITVRIEPAGPDNCPANNSLTILEDAVPVTVSLSPELAAKFAGGNYLGSKSWEDWAQAQVKLWNDTVAAQSRFSFAPEGSLERIRINGFGGNGSASAGIPVDATPQLASVSFLKRLGTAIGLIDGTVFQMPASKVQVTGSITRSNVDLYPGIMGYGDTRFEGGVPGVIPLPFVPAYVATLVGSFLEPTDLLCANDVSALNGHLMTGALKPTDALAPISKAIILRTLDYQGTELPNADLLFFQTSAAGVPGGDPVFAIKTNDHGIAILNSRGSGSPFGQFTPSGDNGLFLIQAKLNGVLETGWLSAWQLAEETQRGAITVSLYLNLPGTPLDRTTNLAPDRILTDSTQSLPAKLAPLIDEDESTSAQLPDTAGSWVEIDLGRDRFIGEVDLVSDGKPFWQQFDISVYGTGQRMAEASLFARELNWPWSSTVRKDPGKSASTFTIAYRGFPERVRYIRVINKSGGSGSLAEIKVFAAKLGQ